MNSRLSEEDQEREAAIRKAAEQERLAMLEAMREVLRNSHSRKFLWWVISQCQIYTVSRSNSSDVYKLEGKREVGQAIIAQLDELSPDTFARFQLEMIQDRMAQEVAKKEPNDSER